MSVQLLRTSSLFLKRFSGIQSLYGLHALERLRRSHITVVGVGGVGSWAAEALARSGVGVLTIIDLDHISISNTNRQIHANMHTFGDSKVLSMAKRLSEINPEITVHTVDDFLTLDNCDLVMPVDSELTIDAIDDGVVKTHLCVWHKSTNRALIMCGSAGGRYSPLHLKLADLSATDTDPLLSKIRHYLRRKYAFPRKGSFGITTVFSDEPISIQETCLKNGFASVGKLSCQGYGSSVCVTAPMGFLAASVAIDTLLHRPFAYV